MAGDRFKSPVVAAFAKRQLAFDGTSIVTSPIKAGQSILASPQKPVVASPTSKLHSKLYIKLSVFIFLKSVLKNGSKNFHIPDILLSTVSYLLSQFQLLYTKIDGHCNHIFGVSAHPILPKILGNR